MIVFQLFCLKTVINQDFGDCFMGVWNKRNYIKMQSFYHIKATTWENVLFTSMPSENRPCSMPSLIGVLAARLEKP